MWDALRTDDEKGIILDWIESLRDHGLTCVDPISGSGGDSPANKMEELIRSRAAQAKQAHGGFRFTDKTGQMTPLVKFFDTPSVLMSELVNCGWVVPGKPGRSMFLQRIASNGGPMDGVFSAAEITVISDWIADGAKEPDPVTVTTFRTLSEAPPTLAQVRHLIGMGALH
jgi:hypothetical protein